MRSRSLWRPFIIAASFVFYAGWDWRFCFLLAFSIAWNQVVRASRSTAGATHATRKQLLAVALAGNLGLLGYFKYYDFFVTSTNNLFALVGHRRAARGALDPPSGRHLLLHVHGDQLRRRRLPGRLRARRARDVRRVPLVLPASRRRADRAAGRADPAVPLAARPPLRRHVARVLPHRHRAVHEGRDRQSPRGEHRRRGLRRAEPALVARGARGDLRLLGADLRRLLRVHEHRDRDRPPPRVHVPAELRCARTRRRRSRTSGAAGT